MKLKHINQVFFRKWDLTQVYFSRWNPALRYDNTIRELQYPVPVYAVYNSLVSTIICNPTQSHIMHNCYTNHTMAMVLHTTYILL